MTECINDAGAQIVLENHLPHFYLLSILLIKWLMVCFIASEAVQRLQNFLQLCLLICKLFSLLYLCPFESGLILKSWVKIATLVIHYLKKTLREVEVALEVLVMWSCSSAGMWLCVIYHLAGCWPGFNRALHQSTLSEVSIKNTSLLLLFCGRKSGWHNHSLTELVVRKEIWVLLSPSNQILIRVGLVSSDQRCAECDCLYLL